MALDRWDDVQLAAAIEQGGALLVDLRADWCPQCGPQEGVLERIAPEFEGRVTFSSIDVEQHPVILDAYGILGLPAMLLFKEGEHKDTINGFKRAPVVRNSLKKLLN